MKTKAWFLTFLLVITAISFSSEVTCKPHKNRCLTDAYHFQNNIPPRLQWNHNFGYCGEVSFISAGLFYGQYLSQYTVRAIASPNIPQSKRKSQLMLGNNDQYAAAQLHLNSVEWDSVGEQSTSQFLSWVKEQVLKGYPVVIGIYTNEYLFYGNQDPDAGDAEFDHIVPVIGIATNHALNDFSYYPDDIIYFSDNGLWSGSDPKNPPYIFNYSFDSFQATRQEANKKRGPIYSLSNDGTNYGIALTGVRDLYGETLPIKVETNLNDESPEIAEGSNTSPSPMPLILKITISGLESDVEYNLYRYDNLANVPDENFNAQAGKASKSWKFQIDSGNTYSITEQINSDEIVVYRAVKAAAP